MLIPRVNPEMLRSRPDQFCETLNKVIDKLNKIEEK